MEHNFDADEMQHALALLHRVEAMRKAKIGCDLIIKVEGSELSVHRSVMRASSDYIDAMLSHDSIESKTGVIEMGCGKYEAVKKLVDFCYTGKISSSEESVEELLYAATMMQVKHVCGQLASFLESQISLKSLFSIKKIATKFDLVKLDILCDNFAVKNLELIVNEEMFCHIEFEYLSFLLTSCKSTPRSEDLKLRALLLWIKADNDSRRSYLIPLMQLLDLKKVSRQYGTFLVENERLCYESTECMKMLYLAGMEKLVLAENPVANTILVFDLTWDHLQAYDPSKKLWSRMHPLHEDLLYPDKCSYTAVTLSGFVYVLMQNKRAYKLCMSSKRSRWEAVPKLLSFHGQWMRATTLNNYIYVTGNGAFERYFSSESTWEKLDTGGCCCDQNELVSFNKSIYSFGGARNSSTCDEAWAYSHTSKFWTQLTSLPQPTATPAGVFYRGKIFLAGGFARSKGVFCFDPFHDSWTEVAPMNMNRNRFKLCVIDDELFAIGNCCRSPLTMERYSQDENIWRTMSSKPNMRAFARATVSIDL